MDISVPMEGNQITFIHKHILVGMGIFSHFNFRVLAVPNERVLIKSLFFFLL